MAFIPLFLLFLLIVSVDSLTDPSVPDMFFSFGTDEGDSVVPVGDDTSSSAVNIPTGFPFLHSNYSTVFVSEHVWTRILIDDCVLTEIT